MTLEMLVDELKRLERPISQDARTLLLSSLRVHPVPSIDGRRSVEWKRGNIYFHALQDALYADGVFRNTMIRYSEDG